MPCVFRRIIPLTFHWTPAYPAPQTIRAAEHGRAPVPAEPITAPCVFRRMATKPLLPEVVAERAKAAKDYRREQQAAIDRIATLRAARLKRDAEQTKVKARK